VIIPGGGLTTDGKLPAWSKARFNAALYYKDQTRFFIPLSVGTTHKPPPSTESGFPVIESKVGAE
jgi:hypothetical protein